MQMNGSHSILHRIQLSDRIVLLFLILLFFLLHLCIERLTTLGLLFLFLKFLQKLRAHLDLNL